MSRSWRLRRQIFFLFKFTLRKNRRFSRGVILIGALGKVLRLPLLQESGRLRQKRVKFSFIKTKENPYVIMAETENPLPPNTHPHSASHPRAALHTCDTDRTPTGHRQGRARVHLINSLLSSPLSGSRVKAGLTWRLSIQVMGRLWAPKRRRLRRFEVLGLQLLLGL